MKLINKINKKISEYFPEQTAIFKTIYWSIAVMIIFSMFVIIGAFTISVVRLM